MSELALGRHRPPAAIPDDLSPGLPPAPSAGEQGPPLSAALEEYQRIRAAIEKVGEATARLGFDVVPGVASGQTNSSGVAVIGLYQVAAGVEGRIHRLTVNGVVPATNAAYTFAVPYSNAAAYLQLYAAEVPDQAAALSNSGLLDGGPPAAGGPILPAVFSWDYESAPVVRGPMWFVAYIVGGPVSTSISARYQIGLRRSTGIA